MAWWERDYTGPRESGEPRGWSINWPPRATMTLLVLHVLAFAIMFIDSREMTSSPLDNIIMAAGGNHPIAIALHPFATSGLSIILVLYVTWVLGGRIERRFGQRRLLRLYIHGNLSAGAAYFIMAYVLGDTFLVPLVYPVGAMAAWCLTAWLRFQDEMVMIRGRLLTVGKVAAIGGAIVVGYYILFYRSESTAWLVAAIAGFLAVPLAEKLPIIRISRTASATSGGLRPSTPASRPARREAGPDIDDILTKIHERGMDSLTEEERERLEAARQAKLRS